jgi:hypothetical protein
MSKKSKKNFRDTSKIKAKTSVSSTKSGEEFDPDYSYVIKDLKRIGVLAGTFFVILIALSFVL